MLTILGLVAVIAATVHVYKTAKDTNRNAVVWALVTLAVGLGFQLVIPLLIGIVIGVVMLASGKNETEIQAAILPAATIIGLVCLVLSFVGIWLIARQVSKIPEGGAPFPAPPAPPTFDGK